MITQLRNSSLFQHSSVQSTSEWMFMKELNLTSWFQYLNEVVVAKRSFLHESWSLSSFVHPLYQMLWIWCRNVLISCMDDKWSKGILKFLHCLRYSLSSILSVAMVDRCEFGEEQNSSLTNRVILLRRLRLNTLSMDQK